MAFPIMNLQYKAWRKPRETKHGNLPDKSTTYFFDAYFQVDILASKTYYNRHDY